MTNRFETRRRARRREKVAQVQEAAASRRAAPDPSPMWDRSRVTGTVQNADPYTGHATVYRCVRVIVGAAISAPLVAKKGQKETGTVLEEGPWADLLLHPNPIQTRREFVEAFLTYYALDGEVGLYLEGENGPARIDEVPKEVWPVRSASSATPVQDPGSKTILGWKLRQGNDEIEVPESSFFLIRNFNPRNPLRGLSPITAAATGLRSDQKAEAWGEAFFDNSAEPGLILSTEGALTPDQRREMREAWEERHRGVSRRGRVAVLEGGLRAETVGISQRDMEYLEQRRWNERQVAKVYGVPLFFLMGQEDISYASTRQNKRALWELTVLPLLAMIEDVLEARLTATRDPAVWLEFDRTQVEALRDDLDANLGAAEKMTRLGYPLNQVNQRLELGMESQPWGDVGLLPMGTAPAEDVASGMAGGFGQVGLDPIGGPDEEGDGDPLPQQDKPQESTATGSSAEPIRTFGIRVKETESEGRERRVQVWRGLERGVFRPGSGKFRRRFEGWNRGRRAEVLRFLGGLDSRGISDADSGSILAFLAEAEERWAKTLRKQTAPVYRQIVQAAANGISRELGGLAIFSMGNPEVASFMLQKEILVQGVSKTVLEGLRDQITRGIAEGESVRDLQERARHVFRASRNRSLTIARTEAAQTGNGARHLAMKVERVEASEWMTSEDEFVRDETASKRLRPKANHRGLDGRVVPIGSTFEPGIHLHHPGDVKAPAWWVVNCRCGAAPSRS